VCSEEQAKVVWCSRQAANDGRSGRRIDRKCAPRRLIHCPWKISI
jgi:hypothetical protein